MQVAHQNMPLSSLIIGVDLVPIKQVGTCVTFAEDIRSEKCRQLIRKELKTWDADVFLHDGAPNVGANWIFDAFQQNELTLFALKLATEFMRKGAWFVTKVFRSKDYHALMWLFKKLFKKVFATKPQASRHESAEIFIVCEGFLKPDKIDPRLLDPKHIFKEMEKETDDSWEKGNQVSQLFKVIEKAKKKAVGYEDETILSKKVSVKDYLANETFAELLANYNEIEIDDADCLRHEATTPEVKECCKDLRVLGRKELKLLIAWRKKLIKFFDDDQKKKNATTSEEGGGEEEPSEKEEGMELDGIEANADGEEEEEEEEDDLEAAIKSTADSEKKEEKKKKKKDAKKKQKLRERIAMKMVHVGDKFDETRDDEMFDLKRLSMGDKGLKRVVGDDDDDKKGGRKEADAVEMPDVEDSEDSEEEEPLPMKKKLVSFKKNDDDDDDDDDGEAPSLIEKKNMKYMGDKIANETVDSDEEDSVDDMDHDSDVDVDDDDDDEDVDDDDDDGVEDADESNPLIQSLTGDKTKEERLKRKTSVWFAKDVFNQVDDDDDEYEASRVEAARKRKKLKTSKTATAAAKELGSDGEGKKDEADDDATDSDDDSDDDDDCDSEDEKIKRKIIAEEGDKQRQNGEIEVVPTEAGAATNNNNNNDNKTSSKAQMLDPEGLAIASYIIQSRKHRREMEESGFNRWTNNDKKLPDWFVKDEKAHWKNRTPVQITKEMVEEYKKRQMEINARPIKKVAEAKARKKRKAMKQMEKVKKKAEAVVDREGMGEKEKSLEIRKMYKKALNRKKPETKLVVSKKGGKGVKGAKPAKGTKYKVVDPRLKKDKRAAERKAGKSAKKGKSGGAARRPKAGAKGKAKSGGKK